MLQNKLIKADLLLLLLYTVYCLTVILRVNIEGTGYTSPDSEFYLELAQNLKTGHGFYMSNQYPIPAVKTPDNQIFFSMWPVGYPVLIFVISEITPFDVFWASKVLNLLFIGLGFLTLRYLNRQYSYVLAAIYGSYTLIEVYSYTWSEAGFVLGTLWLVIILHRIVKEEEVSRNIYLLFFICLFLFLIRYIGVFTFAFPAAAALHFWMKKEKAVSIRLFWVFLALCLSSIAYFSINYYYTGTTTGGDRLSADTESPAQLAIMFFKAVLNELLVIRHYNFNRTPDLLFVATLFLQSMLLFLVIKKIKSSKAVLAEFKTNSFSHTCLIVAGLYLILATILRSLSPFDALNYRILSPFTFLLYLGIVHYIIAVPDHFTNFKRVKLWVFAFFFLSLLLNLPKKFLLGQLLNG